MRLQDIKIKDIIDRLWITTQRVWGWEYWLYENWQLTSWWRLNVWKNKVFDNTWKNRPQWYPINFIGMYYWVSKEEAIEILQERFYLDKTKKNVRKLNVKI